MFNPVRAFYGMESWYYGNMGARAHERYVYGYYNDIDRYWADYKKNTGFSPRYPYKSGMKYDTGVFDYAKKQVADANRAKFW